MGSGPQGKSLLTMGCLSGYSMRMVCFYVPKWQRLRSTVLKYIMKPTYILFKFIAFSFISKLWLSLVIHLLPLLLLLLLVLSKLCSLSVLNQSRSCLVFSTAGCLFFLVSSLQPVATNVPPPVFRWSTAKIDGFPAVASTAELHPVPHCSPFWWESDLAQSVTAAVFILSTSFCLCTLWLSYTV